jgi:hypothetical protein
MDERERRVVENEATFRLVNERIRAVVSGDEVRHGEPVDGVFVICECGFATCTEKIRVPTSVYEWTRADSVRFVIAAGHALPDLERVVRHGGGYAVVEKVGDARHVASELDPTTPHPTAPPPGSS